MADCELLDNCIFFNEKMEHMPEAADVLKEYYCHCFQKKCARYVYKKVTNKILPDLFPDDMEEVAKELGWELEKKKSDIKVG